MGRRNVIAAVAIGAFLLGGGALLPARGLRPSAASEDPQGRPLRSVAELETAVATDPTNDAAAASLGLAYLAEVKNNADPRYYPKAEASFESALELEPRNFEATFGMAALAAGRHDFPRALRWSREAIVLNPYSSDARGVEGDALLELGRYRAAGRSFQEMVDLKPGLAAFARISYLRELNGDIPGALAAMRRAFHDAGSPGDAAFAAFHVGELHLNEGRVATAEAWFERGNEIAPGATQPLSGLARIAANEGDLDRAIGLIHRLLDINEEPGNAFFLGDLYAAAGDDEAAEEAYDLGLRLDAREVANGTNVSLEASLFAADHGRPRKALRLARAEYRIRRSIQVTDAYAWASYVNGDLHRARRLSKEALRLGTPNALFHFHAGMISLALDRKAMAARHLSEALSMNPVFSLKHRATAERVLACLRSDCGRTHR